MGISQKIFLEKRQEQALTATRIFMSAQQLQYDNSQAGPISALVVDVIPRIRVSTKSPYIYSGITLAILCQYVNI